MTQPRCGDVGESGSDGRSNACPSRPSRPASIAGSVPLFGSLVYSSHGVRRATQVLHAVGLQRPTSSKLRTSVALTATISSGRRITPKGSKWITKTVPLATVAASDVFPAILPPGHPPLDQQQRDPKREGRSSSRAALSARALQRRTPSVQCRLTWTAAGWLVSSLPRRISSPFAQPFLASTARFEAFVRKFDAVDKQES